ncbi:hypothetical protein B0H21DRAFT_820273 [Amylocystis lapponica]|nr:hypothetical protein B0H21DRAFT_820273 [Amylocystis lapponica]
MIRALDEASKNIRLPEPIQMPKQPIHAKDYREITEDGGIGYDWRNQHETKEEYESSTPPTFHVNTIISPLWIDSIGVVCQKPKQPEETGLGLALWGHSEFEWTSAPRFTEQPSYTNGNHGHETSSSLSSLSSLTSLTCLPQFGIAEVNIVEYEIIEGLESSPNHVGVVKWTDEVLEWDPSVKLTPPTPAMLCSLLPHITPAYEEFEQLADPTDAVVIEEGVVEGSSESEAEDGGVEVDGWGEAGGSTL